MAQQEDPRDPATWPEDLRACWDEYVAAGMPDDIPDWLADAGYFDYRQEA